MIFFIISHRRGKVTKKIFVSSIKIELPGLSTDSPGRRSLFHEIGLCTVSVGKKRLAEVQEGTGLIISVGIGAVLQGAGYGGGSLTNLC